MIVNVEFFIVIISGHKPISTCISSGRRSYLVTKRSFVWMVPMGILIIITIAASKPSYITNDTVVVVVSWCGGQ